MSVPQQSKKTTHQVVKVTYDTQHMHKFMLFNILLTLILLFTLFFTISKINTQATQINDLAKMVNEITYKMDQHKNGKISGQKINTIDQRGLLQQIENIFGQNQQQMKKIRTKLNQVQQEVNDSNQELKSIAALVQRQSKSSWEIKQIIEGIKNRLEYFSKLIENLYIPRPDLSSMKETISGTFNDIKDKVGSIFQTNQKQQDGQQSKQLGKGKQEGMMGGIKDRFRRGWRSFSGGQENNYF